MRCVDDLRTGVQLPSPPPFFDHIGSLGFTIQSRSLPSKLALNSSRMSTMSLIKKHIADSWARGLSMNEIVEQVYILKKLRGNTCVDHGYRERLDRYVGSEIERLKRKPSSNAPRPTPSRDGALGDLR